MANCYGLIVEGQFDVGPFNHYVQKISGAGKEVIVLTARGAPNLMTKFPGLLRALERIKEGMPVDKAIVIRDAQNKNVADLYSEFNSRVRNMNFQFREGLHFYIVRQELEALLLADQSALNASIESRGGRPVNTPNQQLETIQDPKSVLQRLVQEAGLVYTSELCNEIASRADIDAIQYRCPSFGEFVRVVSGP